MRCEWLTQNKSDSLILFFNGWGMTSKSIEHLTAENARTRAFDCLHFFDYQNREVPQSNFSGYAKIYLIAWSMGVYMSSLLQLPFTKKIAFCGTGNPIDAGEGIAPKIYTLTIDSFSEKTLPLFSRKIGFAMDTNRPATELRQELIAIQGYDLPKATFFDCAFIASQDCIFPPKAQEKHWAKNAKKIISLNCKHYPFHLFSCWQEILDA